MDRRRVGWQQARLLNHVEGCGTGRKMLTKREQQEGGRYQQKQVPKDASRTVPEHADEHHGRTESENEGFGVMSHRGLGT